MLGVITGDDGDLPSAKRYLRRALKIRKTLSPRTMASVDPRKRRKTPRSISRFKRALTLKPTPEMYYVVGAPILKTVVPR